MSELSPSSPAPTLWTPPPHPPHHETELELWVNAHLGDQNCPFCKPNWHNLDDAARVNSHKYGNDWIEVKVIYPLDPVVPGHVLVITELHTPHAADTDNYPLVGILMQEAVRYIDNLGYQANIITSVGPWATQSVAHTHVHVVPRQPDDKVLLPWTFQKTGGIKRIEASGPGQRGGVYRYATQWLDPGDPDPLDNR